LISVGVNEGVGSWWHGQFVPIAIDTSGNALFLDQRQGAGRLGEHDNEGSVDFDRWPSSLTELLELTATALETGGPTVGGYRRVIAGNRTLDWEFPR
jgi:hypothetical protein